MERPLTFPVLTNASKAHIIGSKPSSPKSTFSITTRQQKKEAISQEPPIEVEALLEMIPVEKIEEPVISNSNSVELLAPVVEPTIPTMEIPSVAAPEPSTLNLSEVACEFCKKLTDDDKMLLCDRCDEGYHTYCLKPPLSQVPGTYFE